MNRRGFIGAFFGSVAAVAINMRMAKAMPEPEPLGYIGMRIKASDQLDEITLDDVVFPNGYMILVSSDIGLQERDYITAGSLGMCQITRIRPTEFGTHWVEFKTVDKMTVTSADDVITYRGHYNA